MSHVAIVAWTDDFRIAKYAEFDTEAEANEHVKRVAGRFPDAFVAEKPDAPIGDWLIDSKSVSISRLPAPAPPTDEERIDSAFPKTDTALVIFEAFFELANDVRSLREQGAITRAQLKDWLKAKLPQ